MKPLTPNQLTELKVLTYFQLPRANYTDPNNTRTTSAATITESPDGLTPEQAYFAITGSGAKSVVVTDSIRLYQLLDAKRWRHRHMEMYEDGVLEGSNSYASLLEGMPESVAEYLAGEMFKGWDKKLIMQVYQDLTKAQAAAAGVYKGGQATFAKHGVEHYRLMGKRSAQVRNQRKEAAA